MARNLSLRPQSLFTATMVCIQLLAMLIFMLSFFDAEQAMFGSPSSVSPMIDDVLESDHNYFKIRTHCAKAERKPLFSKCVLVIVDALRADFVPSIVERNHHQNSLHEFRMPFTESLIKTNGIGMISVSATPTVTMPRIKSIISGTLPSFMDYILNLSAYVFKGENLVENAWKAGKKIVFYGDDTWTQLIPSHMFYRSNATSSFFATDYIEVDTNVTYNVKRELNQLNDWDFMIAHYLGVDHIGHSHGGHNSKLMPEKLMEMDSVIELIYQKIKDNDESYLIVITGDHGMTDIGNHGGSTAQETDTALIFLSSKSTSNVKIKLKADHRVLQLDIASTLSKLIGLPLPNKSKGRLILPAFRQFSAKNDELLCHLFENAIQISFVDYQLSKNHFKLMHEALDAHSKLIDSSLTKHNQIDYQFVTDIYNNYINLIQSTLLTSSTKRSIFSLLTLAVILAFIPIFGILKREYENHHSVIFVKVKDVQTSFTYLTIVLSVIFLASTSFIEMEHYYWYYITSTLVVLHCGKAICNFNAKPIGTTHSGPFSTLLSSNKVKIFSCVLILILLRVTFNWNQLYAYDIGEWLDEAENKRILSAVVICSLIAISFMLSSQRLGKQLCLLVSGFVWVYLYRSHVGTVSSFKIPFFPRIGGNFRAQIVFFHVSLIIFDTLIKRLKLKFNWSFLDNLLPVYSIKSDSSLNTSCVILRTLCTIWVLLSALFLNVHNIPLLAMNIILERIAYNAIHGKENSYKATLALTYLCFAQSAFYSQGNSNTLSTIDVSPAFIGLDSYQPILAGLFMVINMYSLYVFWLLMLFVRLKHYQTIIYATEKLSSIINLLLIIRFTTTAFYMCVVIILQNHLFIWSVLCPKFLYEASLTILNDIVMIFVVFNHIID